MAANLFRLFIVAFIVIKVFVLNKLFCYAQWKATAVPKALIICFIAFYTYFEGFVNFVNSDRKWTPLYDNG